jgi:hypothetical protein
VVSNLAKNCLGAIPTTRFRQGNTLVHPPVSVIHIHYQPAIFEDIAQEAVSLCRQSLVSSSTIIGQRNAPASTLDGELFLVRHLLILKEVANNLDLAGRDTQRQTGQGSVTGDHLLGYTSRPY